MKNKQALTIGGTAEYRIARSSFIFIFFFFSFLLFTRARIELNLIDYVYFHTHSIQSYHTNHTTQRPTPNRQQHWTYASESTGKERRQGDFVVPSLDKTYLTITLTST